MAAVVGKYAANKLLGKQMDKYKSKKPNDGSDPYFAMVEDPRTGKLKKVKKQIPAYIPEHDADILSTVRRRAYRWDMSLFNLFGIRFGWEAVIGIIPAVGDALGVFFALLLFKKCCQIEGGLNNSIKMRMLLNIMIDFAVGLVPFVGDLADAAFKCNTKNLRMLERELDKKYKPNQRDERDLAGVDRVDRDKRRKNRASGIYMPQDPPPATAFEDFSDAEDDRRQYPRDQGRTQYVREEQTADRVREPQPARTERTQSQRDRPSQRDRRGEMSERR